MVIFSYKEDYSPDSHTVDLYSELFDDLTKEFYLDKFDDLELQLTEDLTKLDHSEVG